MNVLYPAFRPTPDNKIILLEDYIVDDTLTLPKGYISNGANIPRCFWSIIPPFKPKYLPAVIVHDYLCDLEEYSKADYYFETILFIIDKCVETKAMVESVKTYHKLKYKV